MAFATIGAEAIDIASSAPIATSNMKDPKGAPKGKRMPQPCSQHEGQRRLGRKNRDRDEGSRNERQTNSDHEGEETVYELIRGAPTAIITRSVHDAE
jgi:hypothetical protein